MKKILFVLVIILAACGHNGPARGEVLDKEYKAAQTIMVNMPYCTTVNKITTCSPRFMPIFYPEKWSLYIKNGKEKGWRDVSESMYNSCQLYHYCDTDPGNK